MITAAIKAKVVPMIHGSPGIGKSQIVYQIAKTYNLLVIDIRLSQCDPTDLAGFPTIAGGKADYVPMAHFPIEGDAMPINPETGERYAGWLLFLDESTSAPPAIQAAAYKLVLDRMVGSHRLHKKVAMVLAGNLETDGAIVHPMSTALQSRLVHLELVVDHKEFLDWAYVNGVYHRITDFVKFKPGMIYTFSPEHTDKTYACPRTWAFADAILKVEKESSPDLLPLLAGTISEGVAREFLGFCKVYDKIPKIEAIEANPTTVVVPQEPSIIWALTGSIADNIHKGNASQLMTFVTRLPREFQVVSMLEISRKHEPLQKHPAVTAWVAEFGEALF